MYIQHINRVISLSQIINRNQARFKIRFSSGEEHINRDYCLKIVRKRANFARFDAVVVDETPEEEIEDLKKYSIIYGMKYLYAADVLSLETIPVKVLKYSDNLDNSVVAEFFNADYLSLSAYEKGIFIDGLMKRKKMRLAVISKKTGFSYNSLHTMYSAYNTSKIYPSLETAYKKCLVTAAIVLYSKSFYEEIPMGRHQELTDFIIRNGNYAAGLLKRAVSNRDEDISKAQAILAEIRSIRKPAEPEKEKRIDRIIASLKKDGVYLSMKDMMKITERMKSDRKFNKQILSYQTLRDKCHKAYKRLSAALPEELILGFDTAVTLPDRTQFSYAVPPQVKKICRNNIPKDKNERRLFARIMEYIDRTNTVLEPKNLLYETNEITGKPEMQQLFCDFFRYSILYRNMRDKLIPEILTK